MHVQDDFNNQLWNVVMLAMGGSALGEAVKSSGLLEAIATGIQDVIVGYGTWGVLAIFCALVLVATTFISHTVGAMVILPIVQAVGADMTVSPLPASIIAPLAGADLSHAGCWGRHERESLPVSVVAPLAVGELFHMMRCGKLTRGSLQHDLWSVVSASSSEHICCGI